MLEKKTTRTKTGSLWPALALVAACCLLLTGQVAHAFFPGPDAPRIGAYALRESVSLRGMWRFQPGDDPAWASPRYDDAGWAGMAVPGRWPRGGFPESGQFAWYRLSLKLDREQIGPDLLSRLAVRMGKVLSAYELYAGGRLVGGVGKLPPLSEVNYDRQRVFQVPAAAVSPDGHLLLALRVWGGDVDSVNAWPAGPSSGEYLLGEYDSLLMDGIISEVPGLLFCVLILAFGCYHLYLYRRNPSLDPYLWFGLMALDIGIYGLMLTQWKYLADFSFLAMKKIEFGTIYLFPALAIQMIWSLLQLPISRWLRLYQASFVLFSLLVVVIPGHKVHYHTLNLWQLWTFPLMIYTPITMLRATRAGNVEARTLLIGALVFLATCVNDVLIDLVYLDTRRIVPYGFVAILIAMAISMANRFTRMYSSLEFEVAQRTNELIEANEHLARAARVDHLTGLLNRRGFTEEAEAEIRRVFRSGKNFSLILADVDNFKLFNDRHGHVCGDHVLKRIAAILTERSRDVDRVARWGGEEFMILLPETGAEGAGVLAEKLREAVAENRFELGDLRLNITMTFGIAELRRGESLETCIARADTALYHGKERGRNKVMIGKHKGLTLVN